VNYLGRIAVLARYDYEFEDQEQQIKRLTEFLNDLGEGEIEYVTTDPDYGRDHIEHYADDLDLDDLVQPDTHLADAIKEARDQGHDDDLITQTLLDTVEYDTFNTYPSGDALFYQDIGDIEIALDNEISGRVNGVDVEDVWSALKQGLSAAQINQANRGCHYQVRRDVLMINSQNMGWQAVPDLTAFQAALGPPSDGLSAFERRPTPDHGGHTNHHQKRIKGDEVVPVATPVPHAKEQLLRHLLRYAR